MRVLVVSQYYWPEDFAAGVYIPELAERMAAFGHDVTVITGPPSYPSGRIAPGYNRLFMTERHAGVRVVRIWFPPSARNARAVRRGLTALSFALGALPASLAVDRPDVILGFSPPVFMGGAAAALARRWNVPWLLNVKDLFTESIVSSGLLTRGSSAAALLARLERAVYHDATRIVINARGFGDALETMGVPRDRITLIPDWADGEFIRPMPRQNRVRSEWGLGNQFIVLYSGSLGYSSDLETAIEAAARLKDMPHIRLVIVGEGVKKRALEARVASLHLENVIFKPLQPRARVPEVLAAADLSLVTLSDAGGRVSTQGKLYSLLAAGRPVLAIAPTGNDARRIVEDAGCGWGVEPGDVAGVDRIVRAAVSSPEVLAGKGNAARAIFDRSYSLEICARRFEAELLNLSFAGGTQAVPAGRPSP